MSFCFCRGTCLISYHLLMFQQAILIFMSHFLFYLIYCTYCHSSMQENALLISCGRRKGLQYCFYNYCSWYLVVLKTFHAQSSLRFCFAELILQIDQKITELVTEQQKTDAKRSHDKSELEQLKQDIANANKQKRLISKALENKVFVALPTFMQFL